MTSPPDVTEVGDMKEVAKIVGSKKCILFLGAGVHYPPPEDLRYTHQGTPYEYPGDQRPPLGSELSLGLARDSNFSRDYPRADPANLQRTSLHYELEKDRQQMIATVIERVDVGNPSPVVRALAQLDFPLICTTNYDRLFEKALWQAGKSPSVAIYSKNKYADTLDYPSEVPDPSRPFVYKIHGSVEMPESIVITDEDYIDFVLRMGDKGQNNPIPETFLFLLKKWPTIFVGYSLMDYNLRLLFKTLSWIGDRAKIPSSYSVDKAPDTLIYKFYSPPKGFVRFIVQNVWDFVPELYLRVKGEEMPL